MESVCKDSVKPNFDGSESKRMPLREDTFVKTGLSQDGGRKPCQTIVAGMERHQDNITGFPDDGNRDSAAVSEVSWPLVTASCGKRYVTFTGFPCVFPATVGNCDAQLCHIAWESPVEHAPRWYGYREGKLWIARGVQTEGKTGYESVPFAPLANAWIYDRMSVRVFGRIGLETLLAVVVGCEQPSMHSALWKGCQRAGRNRQILCSCADVCHISVRPIATRRGRRAVGLYSQILHMGCGGMSKSMFLFAGKCG